MATILFEYLLWQKGLKGLHQRCGRVALCAYLD
jgi:hypothetical protein